LEIVNPAKEGIEAGRIGGKQMQDPCANGTALLHHRLGPTAGVRADQPGAVQQIIQTVLDGVPVWGMLMVGIGGELPRFGQGMDGDDFARPAQVHLWSLLNELV
jgi:hypothetical protein